MLRVKYYVGLSNKEGKPIAKENRDFLDKIIDKFLTGATIYKATGLWMEKHESSLIVEVIIEDQKELAKFEEYLGLFLRFTDREYIIKTVEQVEMHFIQNSKYPTI